MCATSAKWLGGPDAVLIKIAQREGDLHVVVSLPVGVLNEPDEASDGVLFCNFKISLMEEDVLPPVRHSSEHKE